MSGSPGSRRCRGKTLEFGRGAGGSDPYIDQVVVAGTQERVRKGPPGSWEPLGVQGGMEFRHNLCCNQSC